MMRSAAPLDRRYAMRGVLPLNTLSVPADKGCTSYLGIVPLQQSRHAVIVGIGVRPQIRSVLELAAGFRRLEQQRGGEFRAVEMPVERLALAGRP